MRELFYIIVILFYALGFSQNTRTVGDIEIYKKEVKETILSFFEGFHSGDTLSLKKVIDYELVLQTIVTDKNGKTGVKKMNAQKFITAIANKPSDQHWNEKLLSFTITANEEIANAWTPYEFYLNGNYSHCGVNIFQLYNDGNGWKIIAVADTRHRDPCK